MKAVTHNHTIQFVHRLNDDGTIDSICRECFVTVATAVSESALEREERKHICDPLLLERYKNSTHREYSSRF